MSFTVNTALLLSLTNEKEVCDVNSNEWSHRTDLRENSAGLMTDYEADRFKCEYQPTNRKMIHDVEDSLDDLRQRANHSFAHGDYDAALCLYTSAIEKAETTKDKQALIVNLCNRAACLSKMERYEEAQADSTLALEISEGRSLKAFYRLAKSQISLQLFGAAVGTIEAALEVLKESELPEANIGQMKAFKDLLLEARRGESKINDDEQLTSIKDVKRGVSIREFIKSTELGCGNFSEIVICHHRKTGEAFALKIIEKKRAADLAKRQHPNVYNEIQMERRVLLERLPCHVNIVRMYHAFQDYNSLYYLMDLHQEGGDMWNSLRENGAMVGCHRSLTKVYLAELVDALEHMHSHGIVHRDLKPENILFTSTGHLLLIDFGTAKDLLQTDLNGPEFVGTPDFMAPEAVQGTGSLKEAEESNKLGTVGADHTLDLYDLGAVAFQLHTGMTPYWSPSPYLTFLKIKRGNLMRPWGIADDDAWNFISSLMRVEASKRLGAECFCVSGNLNRTITRKAGGYDVIRQHPYFTERNVFAVPALDSNYKHKTPIPSLRDLCIRACAELVRQDSLDLDICDRHPPGDGSSHDVLRLDVRDRKCIMHHLERHKLLREPSIFRRFFKSVEECRLNKIREDSRDYIGLTRMSDEQYKFPDPREHDPYAEAKALDPIEIVQITNPLLVREINACCSSDDRKAYIKLFKKCVSRINRSRPKLVIVAGFIDDTCQKILARISDSIPVVLVEGSRFFSIWINGIECIALASGSLEEDSAQMKWLREELEQCRMAKYHMFAFVDCDPQQLCQLLSKRLARGKVHLLSGVSQDEQCLHARVSYESNEQLDDLSIKSTDSSEEDSDNHVMQVVASSENGLRFITVLDRETWRTKFISVSAI